MGAPVNVTNPNQFQNETDLVVVPPSQNCPTGAAFIAFNDLTPPNPPNQDSFLNVARTLTPTTCPLCSWTAYGRSALRDAARRADITLLGVEGDPQIEVGPDGTLLMVAMTTRRETPSEPDGLMAFRSTNCGRTWLANYAVSPGAPFAQAQLGTVTDVDRPLLHINPNRPSFAYLSFSAQTTERRVQALVVSRDAGLHWTQPLWVADQPSMQVPPVVHTTNEVAFSNVGLIVTTPDNQPVPPPVGGFRRGFSQQFCLVPDPGIESAEQPVCRPNVNLFGAVRVAQRPSLLIDKVTGNRNHQVQASNGIRNDVTPTLQYINGSWVASIVYYEELLNAHAAYVLSSPDGIKWTSEYSSMVKNPDGPLLTIDGLDAVWPTVAVGVSGRSMLFAWADNRIQIPGQPLADANRAIDFYGAAALTPPPNASWSWLAGAPNSLRAGRGPFLPRVSADNTGRYFGDYFRCAGLDAIGQTERWLCAIWESTANNPAVVFDESHVVASVVTARAAP